MKKFLSILTLMLLPLALQAIITRGGSATFVDNGETYKFVPNPGSGFTGRISPTTLPTTIIEPGVYEEGSVIITDENGSRRVLKDYKKEDFLGSYSYKTRHGEPRSFYFDVEGYKFKVEDTVYAIYSFKDYFYILRKTNPSGHSTYTKVDKVQ